MAMVDVWKMRMGVHEPFMTMAMGMRLVDRLLRRVFMLMVLVVYVRMFMFQLFVHMFVPVPLGNVKPHAGNHAKASKEKA